jgi:hypothetical protein
VEVAVKPKEKVAVAKPAVPVPKKPTEVAVKPTEVVAKSAVGPTATNKNTQRRPRPM